MSGPFQAGPARPGARSPAASRHGEATVSARPDPADPRREHDALAARLAVRRSIDLMRRFAYCAFSGFIMGGLAAKLAWDRWFSVRVTRFRGPPVYFFVTLAITAVLVAFAAHYLVRARRLMRSEDALYARMRELRDRLGLDP